MKKRKENNIMKKKKITKREMFEIIAAGTSSEDIKEFCEKEIAALDARYAKAKERAAKKKAEGDALKDLVESVLTPQFQCIADIAAKINDENITVSKIIYRLTALVNDEIQWSHGGIVTLLDDKTGLFYGYVV